MKTTHATFQTIDLRTTIVRANLPRRGRVHATLPINPRALHEWFHTPPAIRTPPRERFPRLKEHQYAFLQELHAANL